MTRPSAALYEEALALAESEGIGVEQAMVRLQTPQIADVQVRQFAELKVTTAIPSMIRSLSDGLSPLMALYDSLVQLGAIDPVDSDGDR